MMLRPSQLHKLMNDAAVERAREEYEAYVKHLGIIHGGPVIDGSYTVVKKRAELTLEAPPATHSPPAASSK